MKKSIKVTPKKRRGRPATGRDPHVTSRMPPSLIASVEAWAAANDTTRSEAIRCLVELGLTVKTERRLKDEGAKQPQETKQRARELAIAAVDDMTDTTASPDDQVSRRRRLIKGPEEFIGIRRDRWNRK
jgi:hypothetical protein